MNMFHLVRKKTIQDEFLPIRMDGDDNPQTLWSCIIELDGPMA